MRLLAALVAAAGLAAAGCVTVSEGVGSLGEVGADSVMLVGKIEIVPKVKPEEQKFRAGLDVFNTKRHHIGRAILYMSEKPKYQERTDEALNPPLEETYFLKVPRSHRFVVRGSVTMALVARAVTATQSVVDHTELLGADRVRHPPHRQGDLRRHTPVASRRVPRGHEGRGVRPFRRCSRRLHQEVRRGPVTAQGPAEARPHQLNSRRLNADVDLAEPDRSSLPRCDPRYDRPWPERDRLQ
jgi:hypothetical protein